MGELKPCPFCGDEVEISSEGDYWEVRCEDCQLAMWHEDREWLEQIWERRK